MSLPTESGEFATNLTAEIAAPLLPFAKEGYKTDDFVSHEHLNYFFNLYYRFMESVKAGDATFKQMSSISDLKNYDVSAVLAGYFYIPKLGIYYFNGLIDSPVFDTTIKFSPATPKTGNKGIYNLILTDPNAIFEFIDEELLDTEEIIKNISSKVETNLESINLINVKINQVTKIIKLIKMPNSAYTSISANTNQSKIFTVSGAGLAAGKNYVINCQPLTGLQDGLIIESVKVTDTDELTVKIRNLTGSAIMPTSQSYMFIIYE